VPCLEFGDSGVVRLGLYGMSGWRDGDETHYTVTSPPAVIGDIIIVGSAINGSRRLFEGAGVVRAFDARTGKLRWSFDALGQGSANSNSGQRVATNARPLVGAEVWSLISTDSKRDMVFLPTSSAAPDMYGGDRPGRNQFANSVVALRASTGKVLWAFQVVRHDLWDYDVAAQPVLVTLRRNNGDVPAVVVGTKMGMLFVLHRETGESLGRVEERPVPLSDVPGETASPTQLFALRPPPLYGARLTSDSAFGIDERDRAFCRERLSRLRNDGLFTPPSLEGTLVWPGFWGGINWDGMAWDPQRQLMVTTAKRLAMVVQLHRRNDVPLAVRARPRGFQYIAQEGAPYAATRGPLVAPSGVPCTPPPWGELVAFDLSAGSVKWRRALGTIPWLSHVHGSSRWGSLLFGGPLTTAGGLVFVAASQDDRFRAFDIETGSLLWEYELPAGGQAAPMTYRYDGRQYVVIAAGGRGGIGSAGDWIVSFALPS
jgi:quinoprotein glucose dehydrogenase